MLKPIRATVSIDSPSYDSENAETYPLNIVVNVPDGVAGKQLTVTPGGIERGT